MSRADVNHLSFAHERPLGDVVRERLEPFNATVADTLKITDCADGRVIVGEVIGGREDCCDVNNESRNLIIGTPETRWYPRGKYAFTIKGGSKDITIRGILCGHGKQADVALGEHSDQSRNRTEGIRVELTTEDGSPITWQRINATSPTFLPGVRHERVGTVPGFLRTLWPAFWRLLKKLFGV